MEEAGSCYCRPLRNTTHHRTVIRMRDPDRLIARREDTLERDAEVDHEEGLHVVMRLATSRCCNRRTIQGRIRGVRRIGRRPVLRFHRKIVIRRTSVIRDRAGYVHRVCVLWHLIRDESMVLSTGHLAERPIC